MVRIRVLLENHNTLLIAPNKLIVYDGCLFSGLLCSICHIPGNLLNSVFHRVSPFLVRGKKGATFWLDEAIGYEVVYNSKHKFAWFGKPPGVLGPKLPLTNEYLGNGVNHVTGSHF